MKKINLKTAKIDYVWDYLIPENNNRSEKIIKIIKPFLKQKENVLDVNCGFSPTTDYLVNQYKNTVTGFDINQFSINYCQKKYDKNFSKFFVIDDKDYVHEGPLDVLIHLGISPSQHPLESKTEKDTTIKLIFEKQPRVIIIESAINYKSNLDILKEILINSQAYKLVQDKIYTFKVVNNSSTNKHYKSALIRELIIFTKTESSLFSLNKKILTQLIFDTFPASQVQSIHDLNIGFGFLYYSFARVLRPKHTVVLGSLKGFSPICFSLGIKDNNNDGKLSFVDAGYSDNIEGKKIADGGEGFWKNNKNVNKLLKKFDVTSIFILYLQRTDKFIKIFQKKNLLPIDLLYIDANHSYEGFKYDFEKYSALLSENGIIAFHDVLVDENNNGYAFGIKKYYYKQLINNRNFETFTVPLWPGLCLARKRTKYVNSFFQKNFLKGIKARYGEIIKIYQSKMWKILLLYKTIINIPQEMFFNVFLKNKIIIINQLSIANWQKYKKLRLQALKNAPSAFVDSYDSEILLPDSEWQGRLQQTYDKKSWLVFARINDKLIGMVGAIQSDADKLQHSSTLCQLYLDINFRKQYLSDRLLDSLLNNLKIQNIKKVHLYVSKTQIGAIKLYRRCGFKVIGKDKLQLSDGLIHEGLLMAKQLS